MSLIKTGTIKKSYYFNIEIVKLLLKKPEINIESEYYINNNDRNNIQKKTALQLASEIENNQIYQLLSSFKKT